jgi:hypothetical protein
VLNVLMRASPMRLLEKCWTPQTKSWGERLVQNQMALR